MLSLIGKTILNAIWWIYGYILIYAGISPGKNPLKFNSLDCLKTRNNVIPEWEYNVIYSDFRIIRLPAFLRFYKHFTIDTVKQFLSLKM